MPGDDWSEREIDRGAALDREVDRLRGVYRDHAETLSKLAGTAPSKQLARRYQEMIAEINKAIVGLDGVDQDAITRKTGERPAPIPDSEKPTREKPILPPGVPIITPQKPDTEERPILSSYTAAAKPEPAEGDDGALMRIVLIVGLAVVMLAVLGLFVWKFSGDRTASSAGAKPVTIVEPPPKEEPVTPAPEPEPASPLTISPQQQDFGTIAKGTSGVRTFELANRGKSTLTLQVARSRCRCLWYDLPRPLPAGGRGTLTVRLDGGKAPSGVLSESIGISAKSAPDAVAVFEVTADVK
ncbi:MAG: DUF1573 domain-containing protein [Thermoanaerobaculia bacterium]